MSGGAGKWAAAVTDKLELGGLGWKTSIHAKVVNAVVVAASVVLDLNPHPLKAEGAAPNGCHAA